jgi:hypothetical protein
MGWYPSMPAIDDNVYERDGDTVYARKHRADPSTRVEVKIDSGIGITGDSRLSIDQIQEDKMWGEIRRAAKTNPSLQAALERVKVAYYLSKEYEECYGKK